MGRSAAESGSPSQATGPAGLEQLSDRRVTVRCELAEGANPRPHDSAANRTRSRVTAPDPTPASSRANTRRVSLKLAVCGAELIQKSGRLAAPSRQFAGNTRPTAG